MGRRRSSTRRRRLRRNSLFGPPGAGGFDLASLNIQRGRVWNNANGSGRYDVREGGMSNASVELVDEEGRDVRTNRDGVNRFADLQIGDYVFRPVVASGTRLTTPATATINVTRGMAFNNVSFGVQGTRPGGQNGPAGPARGGTRDARVQSVVGDLGASARVSRHPTPSPVYSGERARA